MSKWSWKGAFWAGEKRQAVSSSRVLRLEAELVSAHLKGQGKGAVGRAPIEYIW